MKFTDRHAPPPSYNEVYPSAPSAPPTEHNFPQNSPGWTQQYAHQHPQPIANQPLIQPQLVVTHQHQIPIQSKKINLVTHKFHNKIKKINFFRRHCCKSTDEIWRKSSLNDLSIMP